jgi:predicted nucleic acid-binding protein
MLVDTSVWVSHFRQHEPALAALLEQGEIECHPFIIGELMCGNLRRRREILGLLRDLPQLPVIEHEEALAFVDRHQLMGSGVGWIDVHLLVAAFLAGTPAWSHDRRFNSVARRLGLSHR